MIEIVDAYTRSGNEWCTCCQKKTNTKRIKFSYDGRQGNSVVLCDDCRRELAQVVQAIPLDKVKQARESVQKYINECDEVLANSVAGINMKSGLTLALEILDKLIESEGKE